jgi:hypothetical protein
VLKRAYLRGVVNARDAQAAIAAEDPLIVGH